MQSKNLPKTAPAKSESVCKKAVDRLHDWIRVDDVKNQMAKSMYKTQLHDGEIEVMILSKEIEADVVIIDDANAKKHAKYLQLPVTCTLGVLIKAKKDCMITIPRVGVENWGRKAMDVVKIAYFSGIPVGLT